MQDTGRAPQVREHVTPERFDLLYGRPCLFVTQGAVRTVVPLALGLAAARAAVPRMLGLYDDELAHKCMPPGEGDAVYWHGWGRA